MATFWERAAHSVDSILTICNFSYFPFGPEGGSWVLTGPVLGHCILVSYSNPRLPVEIGRWENPIEEIKCNICERNDIGDDFIILLLGFFFKIRKRKQFLKPYFYKVPNVIKYKELLATENVYLLIK